MGMMTGQYSFILTFFLLVSWELLVPFPYLSFDFED